MVLLEDFGAEPLTVEIGGANDSKHVCLLSRKATQPVTPGIPKSGKRAILKGPRTIETSFSTSSRQLFNQNAKKLKRHIRVNPGKYVIQDDTETTSNSFQLTARKWFDDIEKSKEEKSDQDEKEGLGDPEHGEKISHDLIDDDPSIIDFLPVVLSFFCNPA